MADEVNGSSAGVEDTAPDAALTDEQKKQIEQYNVEKRLAKSQEEAINAKRAVVDAQKNLAVSELALTTANLPASSVTPPTGDVTGDAAGYMAEFVAYQAMERGAQKIAENIHGLPTTKLPENAKILITDNMDVAQGDFPRQLVQLQFDYYKEAFGHLIKKIDSFTQEVEALSGFAEGIPEAEDVDKDQVVEEPEALAAPTLLALLGAAPQVLGAAATVLSYFKTSYAVKSKTVTLVDSALRAAVAGKLEKPCVFSNFHLVEKSTFLDEFVELLKKRYSLETKKKTVKENVQVVLQSDIEKLDAELAALEGGKDKEKHQSLTEQKQALKARKETAEQIVAEAEALITKFDAFHTLLLASENDQDPLLAQAAVQDHILKSGITHLLFLHIESKGGEEMSKTTLWTTGGDTAFLGGIAASYVLAQKNGEVMSAGTVVFASELHRKIGDSGRPKVKDIQMEIPEPAASQTQGA